MKTRVLLALSAAMLAALVTAPAGQASSAQTPDAFREVPVTGTVLGGGTFRGVLDVRQFAARNGELVANGVLNGTLTNALGRTTPVVNQAVPVRIAQITGTCRILHLVLGPLDLDLLGLRIQLSRVVLDITAQRGPGQLLGNLLCAIAGLLDRRPLPLAAIANRINSLAQLSRLLSNVPVNGAGGGNRFGGTLDIERFVTRNGRLMAQGAISGVLRDANGAVVDTVTRSPVLLQIAQIRGTCRILRLVLGPLDLNLLGLRIQLNRVVLNITARRGPGRLLGNLLCAIAGLLDRSAPTGAVANQLNRLVVLRP
jgi:hypothetical protein